MPISTARIMLSDGGTKRRSTAYQQQSNVQTSDLARAKSDQDVWKDNLKTLRQKTQTAATGSAQTPVYTQQQSNVQTPDLAYAKSQPSWQKNMQQKTQTTAAGSAQTPTKADVKANMLLQGGSNILLNDQYAKKFFGETTAAALGVLESQAQYEQAVKNTENGVITDMRAIRLPETAEERRNAKLAYFETLLDKDFKTLGAQTAANDLMRFWQDPTMPVGAPHLQSNVDANLQRKLKTVSNMMGYDYETLLAQAVNDAKQAYVQEQKETTVKMAEDAPFWSSLLSVEMAPVKVAEDIYRATGNFFGWKQDENAVGYRATDFQETVRETVGNRLESQYGKEAALGYNAAMNIADNLLMAGILGSGLIAEGVDVAGNVAGTFTDLLEVGVPPEEAMIQAGVIAGVEALVESGATEEMIGAAIRKTGLTDDLVKLGRKTSGGKEVIDAVEDRLDTQMFKAGMDMYDQDLTQAQEKEWIKLNEHLYGYTDEEIGRLAKLVEEGQSNLTITPWGDIIGETFGDDPRMFKTELEYLPSSGVKLQATPGKTTTVLGRFTEDTGQILNELGNVKSTDLSGRTGGFNLLNTPDELYVQLGPERFWEMCNQPWLDNAIARNDVIVLATKPKPKFCSYYDRELGKTVLTGFGKEYQYLLDHGYQHDEITHQMVKKVGN